MISLRYSTAVNASVSSDTFFASSSEVVIKIALGTVSVREGKKLRSEPLVNSGKDALLDAVWGENYVASSRTLDQHIVQIRRKLGPSGNLIETVRGTGYRLRNS